jgi:hypothetical protein
MVVVREFDGSQPPAAKALSAVDMAHNTNITAKTMDFFMDSSST